MFGNLKRVASTFHAPAAAGREVIHVIAGADRFDPEARTRPLAPGMFARPAFGC